MFSVDIWIIKGVVDLKRNILSFTRHQVVPNLYFFHRRNIFMQFLEQPEVDKMTKCSF